MPKGLRKVEFSFEERYLTLFGGMWLMHRFCQKIGLKRLLQTYVRWDERNRRYHSSDLILALLYAIIMGLRRINKTEILQYNGVFRAMLGLENFPEASTLRRFLKRLPPGVIRQIARLHDSLRGHLYVLPRARTSLIFDLDSMVLVIYGQPQGARVGYNPRKPGRRSYHPLFCFEAHFQEFWHGSLRHGDTVAATGAIPFLEVCLAKAPSAIPRSRIRVRMDSGFYSQRILRFLEGKGLGYIIVAKEYGPIKRRARGCRFKKAAHGWEVGEFWDKVHQKWKKPHRFVVVRRPIPEDPAEAGQLKLFKDRRYAYHVFVTNLKLSPWRAYLFYRPRATIEKNNREFLYDYPLGKIPTHTWTANVAFFQLVLLAADLVHWFKRLCLPRDYLTTTIETIRTDFLVLPAKLVRMASTNVVKLPYGYRHQKEFRQAYREIEKLRLPGKFRFCK